MKKVSELSLDEQKKRNLILKRLNELGNRASPQRYDLTTLEEKYRLQIALDELMGVIPPTPQECQAYWAKKNEEHRKQIALWNQQRLQRRGKS